MSFPKAQIAVCRSIQKELQRTTNNLDEVEKELRELLDELLRQIPVTDDSIAYDVGVEDNIEKHTAKVIGFVKDKLVESYNNGIIAAIHGNPIESRSIKKTDGTSDKLPDES